MAEGNILEVVLSKDVEAKFKAIDDRLASISQNTENTVKAIESMTGVLTSMSGAMGGMATNTEKATASIEKLAEVIGKMSTSGASGIENIGTAFNTIGDSASANINAVNTLAQSLNSLIQVKRGEGKKSPLDSLLFDTSELEAKKAQFLSMLENVKDAITHFGGKYFDVNQLLGTGGVDAAKRLQIVIDELNRSITNTKTNIENTTKKFYSGEFKDGYKEFEKMEQAYIRLQNKLEQLQNKLASAETLKPLLDEFNKIRAEYNQTNADLNTFIQKNKQITDTQKVLEGYKKNLEGIESLFTRLKAEGKAFNSEGGLTGEAKKLLAEKQALEEKIRLYQMSTDEAIKQEQRKNEETDIQEREALSKLKKLYDEKLKLEQQIFDTRQKAATSQSSDSNYYANLEKAAKNYSSRIQEIDREIKQLESDHARAGTEAREAYDTASIKQAIAQEESRQKAIDRTVAALQRVKEASEKANTKETQSLIGLNGNEPKTVNEYILAIKNLKREINNMEVSDKSGIATLREKMKQYKKELDEVMPKQQQFIQSTRQLGDTVRSLAGAFGVAFSAQQLINFGRKVVEITGEFELQHRAMQAIIGDIDQANKLWDKTVRLAVRSPYSVKELVTYTKQLAAYRIETEKLYDTTKMLADISAGLGVDMNRLILAYGQVKAANYLRGQELRQFSEAGVNILQELANYFTELQGRAISTGDVFEMVSKRMVKFEDVATVLRRMTEEGGTFFEMQEIQAETLKGQMMNLRDSVDLLMESIGERKTGMILNVIKGVRSAMEDIQTLIPTINAALAVMATRFIALRVHSLVLAAKTGEWVGMFGKNLTVLIGKMVALNLQQKIRNADMERTIALGKRLSVVEGEVASAAAAGGTAFGGWATIITTVLMVVVAVVTKITEFSRKMKQLSKEIQGTVDEIAGRLPEKMETYDALAQKMDLLNHGSKERSEIIGKINSQYGEYLDFQVTDATTQKELADAYEQVNERMKEKAALEAYQQGLEKIHQTFDKEFSDDEKKLVDKLVEIGLKIQNADGSFSNFAVQKKDAKALVQLLKEMAEEVPIDEWDEAGERARRFTEIIRDYYNFDNLSLLGEDRYLNNFLDNYKDFADKVSELKEDIDASFNTETNSRAANIALKEVQREYEKTIEKLKNTPKDELTKPLAEAFDEAKRKLEKDSIDIKIRFRIMSKEAGEKAKEAIDNWESSLVKSINSQWEKHRGEFDPDLFYDMFINLDEQNSGMTEVEKGIQSMYDSAKEGEEQLLRYKEQGLDIDEEMLANYQERKRAAETMAGILGMTLEKEKKKVENNKTFLLLTEEQVSALEEAAKKYAELKEEMGGEIDPFSDQFKVFREKMEEEFKRLNLGDLLEKNWPEIREEWEKQVKAAEDIVKRFAVEGQQVVSITEKNAADAILSANEYLGPFLAVLTKLEKQPRDNSLDILNKQIDAIKNAAKQYDEYKKMYDDTEAFDKTKHEVEGLFKELNIGHILKNNGAFDENVIKDNLEVWLAKSIAAAGKGGQQVAEKYISGLQLAFEKENYSKTVIEPFKKAMEDAIDAISMGDELEKLGIGRDFGKIIFGIDTTTTKQMREQVEKWKEDLTASGTFGDEAEKEYQKMIEKIDDMEDRAQKERLKKYIGYMQQAMSERARIQVQGLAELAEIERTFQEEIAKAYKTGDTARVQYLQEMQKAAIEGTRKATDEKLQKQTWEDFKKSSMYTELFSDLENLSTKSLTAMREKLTEMQGTLNNLDPQNLKAIAEEIDKLEDAIVKRNPFKSLVDYWRQWQDIQAKGYTEESIVTGLSQKTKEVEAYTDELAGLEKQLYNLQHVQSDDIGAIDVQSDAYKLQLEMLQQQIQEKKNDINATEEEIRELEKMYEILQKLRNAENTFESEWKKMIGTVKSASDSIIDGLSAFGVETDNTTEAFGTLLDSIIDIIAVLPTYIAGMTAAGVAINSAMGVIGLIAEGVTLVIGLVKAIAGIRDAAITDTIDSYKDKVDALSDSYDRIEKAYDKAWDVQNLVTYRNELQKNIDQQIKYYEAMIAAEQTRKDPDESQIREWKNTINDLFDEKDDAQSKFLEELGGITDFKSAAQEFVDAWADAFSETGDGMEGLRDHFNEVLQNMVKKQAMQRVASHYLTGLFDMIDTAIGQNGIVTPEEMDALRAKFEEIAPQFNAALQAIFESLGIFGDQAEGELSGLQKGIQGVTEETAEILAAYLNSVRYYVIDSNTKLGQLQNILQDNTGMVNPMLAELRSIAQRADDIYNFLFQRRENGTDSMRVFVVNA